MVDGRDRLASEIVDAADAIDAVAAATTTPASAANAPAPEPDTDAGPLPVDDAAESAFLAEAKQRGETFAPAPANAVEVEPANGRDLPPLNELVARIPADVRDTLEELFRARFVTVRRLPKQALRR